MVVVVIIGLLAAMAIPTFRTFQRASYASRIANDFRVFAQAFETYTTENGVWPANASAGVVPAGLTDSVKVSAWQEITVIGGRWNWDRGNYDVTAGISISGFTCTDEMLAEIDKRMDDGDLSTGRLRRSAANRITWALER